MPAPPPRTPRYRRLAEELALALQQGRHAVGSRLPSVRQLCADHGASLATVTHALHELEDAGLLQAQPRRGFFVRQAAVPAQPPPDGVPQALHGRRQRLVDLATTQADCLSLSHLALPPALLPLRALQRHASQAMAADPTLLAVGTVCGSAALRAQLARHAQRMGLAVDAEDVIVTQGEGESLELCLRLLTQPGDTVAMACRASPRLLELLASLGLQALPLPSSPDTGLSVPALAFALQHHRVACVVAEPTFDSVCGSALDEAARRQLADLVARHGLPLVECDLMGELHRQAARPRPVKAWDHDDRVLYCGSLACITGAGLSLGWVISRRHRLQLRVARTVHGELLSPLTDATLARLLASPGWHSHLRQLRRRLAAQVADWQAAAQQLLPAGSRVHGGQGGYALWVELPAAPDLALLMPALRAQGYSVMPGTVFGSDAALARGLRLSARHPLDTTHRRGLQVLGRALAQALGAASEVTSTPAAELATAPAPAGGAVAGAGETRQDQRPVASATPVPRPSSSTRASRTSRVSSPSV